MVFHVFGQHIAHHPERQIVVVVGAGGRYEERLELAFTELSHNVVFGDGRYLNMLVVQGIVDH